MPQTLELLDWEINAILQALGEQKYNDVAPIIQHIKEQLEEV